MINFVLVLVFVLAATAFLGRIGWEEVRYREIQAKVRRRIEAEMPGVLLHDYLSTGKPLSRFRGDPPGAQRWAIYSDQLFYPDTAQLTPDGVSKLRTFARVILAHRLEAERQPGVQQPSQYTWRRIRIEGHTRPTKPGEKENWYLSAMRANAVAEVLTTSGVPAWLIAVAGRGGQTPFIQKGTREYRPDDPRHERVEIILEYHATSNVGGR